MLRLISQRRQLKHLAVRPAVFGRAEGEYDRFAANLRDLTFLRQRENEIPFPLRHREDAEPLPFA